MSAALERAAKLGAARLQALADESERSKRHTEAVSYDVGEAARKPGGAFYERMQRWEQEIEDLREAARILENAL